MKVITLYINAIETMEIVRELRQRGMVQGKDFDFSYNKSTEYIMAKASMPNHTNFTFYTDKYATFFALKYSTR